MDTSRQPRIIARIFTGLAIVMISLMAGLAGASAQVDPYNPQPRLQVTAFSECGSGDIEITVNGAETNDVVTATIGDRSATGTATSPVHLSIARAGLAPGTYVVQATSSSGAAGSTQMTLDPDGCEPPVTPNEEDTPVNVVRQSVPRGPLAFTGSEPWPYVVAGAGALLVGALLVARSRRATKH